MNTDKHRVITFRDQWSAASLCYVWRDGKELLADQNVHRANPDFCPGFLYIFTMARISHI